MMLVLMMLSGRREGRPHGGEWPCATACSPWALAAGPVAPIGGGGSARPGAGAPSGEHGVVRPGGDALGLAIREGAQALSQVGHRLEARGLLPLLQAGLQRASLPASRLGPRLATLGAAPRHPVCRSLALQAL